MFSGDILLEGPVWTHLGGGYLPDLVNSYRRLMRSVDDIRHLMPSHNTPWLDASLLPETLQGAKAVLAETAEYDNVTDPWQRELRQYAWPIPDPDPSHRGRALKQPSRLPPS